MIPGVQARREEAEQGWESFGRIDIKELAELPFQEDHSEPNGTSIAVLAAYKNKRVLLAADAHPLARLDDEIEKCRSKAQDRLAGIQGQETGPRPAAGLFYFQNKPHFFVDLSQFGCSIPPFSPA